MESSTSNQTKHPLHKRDLLATTPRASVYRSSLSPDDGYDYRDTGPSPEGSATQEQDNVNSTKTRLQASPSSSAPEHHEDHQGESNPDYRRPAEGWRAKLPDNEDAPNGVSAPNNSHTQRSPAGNKKVRKGRGHPQREATQSILLEPIGKEHLRYVMLQWQKEERDGAQKLVMNALSPGFNAKVESPNHVIWQHSELEDMEVGELEGIINQWKSRGLKESEAGLTRRLLNRIRDQHQRPFIGGSFLTPIARRYIVLDDSKYSADKCCIFVNFPYFAVTKPQARKSFKKGDPKHPIRTLLQSHYRLNETVERDKDQCIRLLQGKKLKSCIDASEMETAHLNSEETQKLTYVPQLFNSEETKELIYVPQLWSLIIGLNKMVTMGPINDIALQGSSFKLQDIVAAREAHRCAFVRISFVNQGSPEELTYPRDQCASWFGLMNKQKQIREILEKGKEHNSPQQYTLHIRSHMIKAITWAHVQYSVREEVLNLWMKTPRPDIPKVSVKNTEGDSDQDSQLTLESGNKFGDEERAEAETSTGFSELSFVPVVSAFLAWDIRDEFGEKDDSSAETKVNRFLKAIYRALPATCRGDVVEPSANATQTEQITRSGESARLRIDIVGKTLSEVQHLVHTRKSNTSGEVYPMERRMIEECIKLFNFFIPSVHERRSEPIKLFWGALYELMSHQGPRISTLLEKIKMINAQAEKVHLGVHCWPDLHIPPGQETPKDAISGNAILLASIVDALGAIFNMMVAAVRDERRRPRSSQETALNNKVSDYADEACELLETARDKLITEAIGAAPGENVGPVLTPEAILIMVMERLVRGVFGSGNVEVIAVYEECLEHLALKVKIRASRRLLQIINAFEEEVAIVNDILMQQEKVLQAFRGYLEPSSFKRPSTARKLRFEFEKKGIERILTSIREQLRNCTELRDRAKVLAVQNVHLVETLQDDNSRAIFVFTFITVLFLPLSFVAGFFGMNVVGITDTKSTTRHFWAIALPITVGIMILCATVVVAGEKIRFAAADLFRFCLNRIAGSGEQRHPA